MQSPAPARASATGNQGAQAFTQLAATNISGDGVSNLIVATANLQNVLAIPRPPNGMRRTFMLIQNRLVGTELFFAFGRNADNGVSCIGIAAGGNLLLDQLQSIPQNDVFLFFPIAGSVPVAFVNAPLQG